MLNNGVEHRCGRLAAKFSPFVHNGEKCSELTYTILCEQPGIVPAPYLARAKWVQIEDPSAMSDEDTRAYINAAYAIISAKLTKKRRLELGLMEAP